MLGAVSKQGWVEGRESKPLPLDVRAKMVMLAHRSSGLDWHPAIVNGVGFCDIIGIPINAGLL